MGSRQFAGIWCLRGAIPALAAMTLTVGLAGGGPAAATVRPATVRAPQAGAPAGTISTVAGGVGGPAKATTVALDAFQSQTCGVTFGGGSLYIANANTVRKVNPRTGWLTTPAGTGIDEPFSDGGPAASASLGGACSVAVDHADNLVAADDLLKRVRVVAARTGTFYGQAMTAGHIYTVAGTGQFGLGQSGIPATQSKMTGPEGVAVDHHGNLVIADTGGTTEGRRTIGGVIRVVAITSGRFYRRKMAAGDIYTVAGFRKGTGFSGDGGPATRAALGTSIGDVKVDRTGNLVLAGITSGRVRVVAARTGTFYGQAMTAGHIYTVAGGGTDSLGNGIPATSADLALGGVATDAAGNLVVTDVTQNLVRVVAAKTGTFYGQAMTADDIYTVAGDGTAGFSGDGGLATSAELSAPSGVTVDTAGNLAISDTSNQRVRLVAASSGTFYGKAMTAGDIYTVAGNGQSSSGTGGPATRAAFATPLIWRVAADAPGDLAIPNDAESLVQWVPASAGTFFGQPMKAGHVYTIAGDGTAGFSGDGGLGTKAELDSPDDVAMDGAGNVLIADPFDYRIRVVAATTGTFYGQSMKAGHIYTIAGDGTAGFSGDGGPATHAELNFPQGVAVDGAGNVLIADRDNVRVRVVAATTGTFYGQSVKAGHIYTIAGDGTVGFSGDGGPATAAEMNVPVSVAVDGAGNVVVADLNNGRVRVVAAATGTFYGQAMTAGDIYTIVGDGDCSVLCLPRDVAVDAAGNVLITDWGPAMGVSALAAATGTFYGQSMKAGHMYTIAGDGTAGFSGDGGPATSAELNFPTGVAVNGAGDALIADSVNARIRMVTGGPVARAGGLAR